MSVLYEVRDRIAVVTIDRPEVRNAVDAQTAQALAEAFCRFDDDEVALVAVLTGAEGYFCAGADLKAVAAVRAAGRFPRNRMCPMGPTAHASQQAGHRGHRRSRGRRRPRARPVVRPSRRGRRRGARRVLSPIRRAAHRSRYDSPAPIDRPQRARWI